MGILWENILFYIDFLHFGKISHTNKMLIIIAAYKLGWNYY
jgi:hypothetical protein